MRERFLKIKQFVVKFETKNKIKIKIQLILI